MSEIPELTFELRARMRYHALQALAYRAQKTPEAKVAIHDYLEAIAPATLIALLDENERHRALISDLLGQSSTPV
ncbi:hypothetical protein [Serratia fonticola]|uniref:hypothetical protein n=1 Tax=Serratia fonticola TaxID=47917 RepID=UPI000E0FD3B5|nr:hypothetical protein [Serratia fonticola]RDL15599.1 hypothetical protein DFO62_1239 [Serratia fonticola]